MYINRGLNKLIPIADELSEVEIPLIGTVSAGFPSEAFNYVEETIDFNKLLVKHKETTFCIACGEESMAGDGISQGDLLVVDKSAEPRENSIVAIFLNGDFTFKRLRYGKGYVELVSSNPKRLPIIVREGEELPYWGVLKFAIISPGGAVSTGFPSEAFNYSEEKVDFNKLLVKHKETTFCLTCGGESMIGDRICPGDLLVVDKLADPFENSIIVLSLNGDFTLKRLRHGKGCVELVSSNPDQPPIIVWEGEELHYWGVLKFAIKRF